MKPFIEFCEITRLLLSHSSIFYMSYTQPAITFAQTKGFEAFKGTQSIFLEV